ncbi:pyridoxal-phosphate dependent enzyme [Azohydromonas caseinilytica]|uniref:L-serine ammonia-lyase n=1 Tax=Azohydromonas caseinilytica TaxID=2728836 RepID=A0A848FGL8_9BURK|nr:pyridoxal-phosphate dependent enzyme [Azohydromonas caseinilytica]NML17310.1 pyridoxal-phosphate dependent enzyme [Azohydromonas caseinilytica]
MPIHLHTPLVESDPFSHPGQRVWLKLEALQPSGSFKLRGVGHACEVHAARGARRLLSSSGGNAGLAVAYAGRRLGLPVLVVVPESTREWPKSLMRRQGAEVVVHGKSWMEANEHLTALRQPMDAFIHPFDDPLLWEGHASMIAEAATQGPRPDAVVLSVGGGGLMCGVLQGMHAVGWQDVPLVAVETLGAHSLNAAVDAGQLVTLEAITSVATSLGARRVCERAFEWTKQHEVIATTVTDDEAVRACLDIADEHRIVVEPACGAAVAAAVQRRVPALQGASNVLVILCGGVATTYGDLQALAAARQEEAI